MFPAWTAHGWIPVAGDGCGNGKDEPQARSAAQVIAAAGWQIRRVDVAVDGGPGWVVIAEKHAVTAPTAVRDARTFFEGFAA